MLNLKNKISTLKLIKLTEKEINTIIYLSKSNKPVSIDELQENFPQFFGVINLI